MLGIKVEPGLELEIKELCAIQKLHLDQLNRNV